MSVAISGDGRKDKKVVQYLDARRRQLTWQIGFPSESLSTRPFLLVSAFGGTGHVISVGCVSLKSSYCYSWTYEISSTSALISVHRVPLQEFCFDEANRDKEIYLILYNRKTYSEWFVGTGSGQFF